MPRELPPQHGTVRRYRFELRRGERPCDACRAAGAEERRRQRLGLPPEPHVPSTAAPAPAETSTPPDEPVTPGPLEEAVRADLAEFPSGMRPAFFLSFAAMAVELARTADTAVSATARSAATKGLFDVLKAIRSEGGGDGPSALDILIADFGTPLVPDFPPAELGGS